MHEQFGEKSHEATPLRRQKAREDGQVAKSQDLASAVLLVGASLLLAYTGSGLANFFRRYARRQLGGASDLGDGLDAALAESYYVLWELAKVMLPTLTALLLVAVLVNVSQVGLLFVPKRLALDISRISPLRGLQRMFSLPTFMRFAFGTFKVIVVTSIAAWSIWGDREAILTLSGLPVGGIAQAVCSLTFWTTLKIGAALLILAILDYIFQRWKHEQDLRMTTQELREELKSLQGDPQLVARRRAVQRQLVLNRLSTLVPKADVVVTNPTELAVAIQYDPETMAAPMLVAKGAGILAQRIRRLALNANIPIVERKDLARSLYKQVEPGHPIPSGQYAAVAELLRYVYQLQGKTMPAVRQAG